MITVLLAWLAIAVCCRVIARVLLKATGDAGVLSNFDSIDRLTIEIALGLVWSGAILLALSLVAPITGAVLVGLVATLILAAILLRRESGFWRLSRRDGVAVAVVALAAAWNVTGELALYDTGLYHLQMVEMLHRYGTVPGAALIHYRFGFSSSWFALAALFDRGIFSGRVGGILDGFVLALAMIHATAVWSRVAAGGISRSDVFLAVAYPLVLFHIFIENAQLSLSPNPGIAIVLVLAGWLVTCSEARAGTDRLAVLLLGGACSVKLTAVPGALATLAVVRNKRVLVAGAAALFIGLLPLVGANYRTTGCPVYPGPLLCAAGERTLDAAQVRLISEETRNWARFKGPFPPNRGFMDTSWIAEWLRRTRLLPLAAVAIAIAVFIARRQLPRPAIVGLVGLVFVLVTAPDERFLSGYVAVLAGSAAATLIPRGGTNTRVLRALGLTQLACVTALLILGDAVARDALFRPVAKDSPPRWHPERLLLPALAPDGPPYRLELAGDVSYVRISGGNQCWRLPFPCTYYAPVKTLRLCSPERGLAGGICRAQKPGVR